MVGKDVYSDEATNARNAPDIDQVAPHSASGSYERKQADGKEAHSVGKGPPAALAPIPGGKAPRPPKKRLRFSNGLPRPPVGNGFRWSKSRDELKGLSPAEITKIVLTSFAWASVMRPALEDLDRARAGRGEYLYTSEELEAVLLYARVANLSDKDALERLAGYDASARFVLGLDRPRNPAKRAARMRRRDGIPGASTLSHHKKRFGQKRLECYRKLFAALRDEHLGLPEFVEETRILNVDGSTVLTHYTCPVVDPKTGTVINKRSVTCPEGGFMPLSAGADKSGHGFTLVTVVTATGMPLEYAVEPLHTSETAMGVEIFSRDLWKRLSPAPTTKNLRVLNGDAIYSSPVLRAKLRRRGIIENIHPVSHRDHNTSHETAAKRAADRIPIDGYPNWRASGHRELFCLCGKGKTAKRIELSGGRACARVEGRCKSCGSITITSGDWRLVQNPKRFIRVMPGDPDDRRDWLFGNPLTFNDAVAAAYGRGRFGYGEGFHGALATRFGVNSGKRWYRRKAQAELEAVMVFSVMHALALEQRRRAAALTSRPPGPAPPASAPAGSASVAVAA